MDTPKAITFNGSYLLKKSFTEVSGVTFEVFLQENGKIDYSISTTGSDVIHLFSPSRISLNTWTHVAVTFDGIKMEIYINGALDSSKELEGTVTMYDSDYDIIISDETFNFIGDIDEVRFWNKALTQEKISRQKDCKIPANTSNLIAYYNFNQGTADSDNTGITTLTDVGSNGLDGIIVSTLTGTTSNFVSNVPSSFDNNAVCYTPSLTTKSADSVTSVSAILGGTITSDGGETITGRGVIYSSEISTDTDLVIDGEDVIEDSNGTGGVIFPKQLQV